MPRPWQKQKVDLLQQIRDLKNDLADHDRKIGAHTAIDALERKVAEKDREIAALRSNLDDILDEMGRSRRKLADIQRALRTLGGLAVEEPV